ncbi:hypothetical protein RBB84_18900 [Rhodococcus sp. D-6]|uniref:Uncharacterized protein n=1 Tax=Rhodococcus sp. D-6 TaxID=1387842 RepID=A0AAU7UUA4_9NOCA|nr:hypothetical protein [Rhodococcus sp. RDE2]BDB63407.1 hypothetical protein RDE2_52010 [Rhodococcus sp. RDE2]
MYYTDLKGEPAVGELWSPGPKMHTVWVLTAGEPIVVDTRTMTEMRYLAPELGVPHSKSAVDAARKVIEACPASGYPRTLTPRDAAEAEAVGHARTVIAERQAFDNDWHQRQIRRGQRAPLSKKAWAELFAARIAEFTVDSPVLLAPAA